MNVLIIYAHPNPNSFYHIGTSKNGLQKADHTFKVIGLTLAEEE